MKKLLTIVGLGSLLIAYAPVPAAAANDDMYGENGTADSNKQLYVPVQAGDATNGNSPAGTDKRLSAPPTMAQNNGMTAGTPSNADTRLSAPPAMAQDNGMTVNGPSGADKRMYQPVSWSGSIDTAVRKGDYNEINVIAAKNPAQQGDIALYLLDTSKKYGGNTTPGIKTFVASAPFVGQIPPAKSDTVIESVNAMLKIAADPKFQQANPDGAADIFYAALIMSSQPGVVAADPTLHFAVLEAADDFLKTIPADSDKLLREEVDLAQAGGAPTTTPRTPVNPSQE